jgi:hypothetical protein
VCVVDFFLWAEIDESRARREERTSTQQQRSRINTGIILSLFEALFKQAVALVAAASLK